MRSILPATLAAVAAVAALTLMHRPALAQAGPASTAPAVLPGAGADEIDTLVAQLKPPARFKDYQPNFRAERRTFTFQHVQGPQESHWWVVLDGDKYVAIHRSGDFNLLALTPDQAKTTLAMPKGRYHLDTQLGPTLCTHQFLKPMKIHGAIYSGDTGATDEWLGGGKTLTLVRSMRTDAQITRHQFVLSVDPIHGYRIDGHYDVRFKAWPPADPKDRRWIGPTFCPGCYPPWPKDRIYDRTVHCPAGGGYRGWANNLLCMDRCDSDRKASSWRDGGFVAYLNPRSGWSVGRTRQDGCGDAVGLSVCNAHNDFHVWLTMPAELPKDERGWFRFKALHRLLALPPELTRHVWDRMDLIQKGATGVFLYVGEPTDFEDQPRALTDPVRGLTWTSGGPAISTDFARSGKKSLLLKGTSWPNLPQVAPDPESRYRLEAWFKLVPWSEQEKAAARQKDQAARARLKADGKPPAPPPEDVDWDQLVPEAFITAHMYEWTPHANKWLVRQQTTTARGDKPDWQRVVLEFDTPRWDPGVNIVLEVRHGRAYMDDFALMKVDSPQHLVPKIWPATEADLAQRQCRDWPTWSCEPKSFPHRYDRTEVCYFTQGRVTVATAVGSYTLEPGQLAIFPKGLECTWTVHEAVKKHYQFE